MRKIIITIVICLFNLSTIQGQIEFQKQIQNFTVLEHYPLTNGIIMKGLDNSAMNVGYAFISDTVAIKWQKFYPNVASSFPNSVISPVNDSVYYHFRWISADTLTVFKTINLTLVWYKKYSLPLAVKFNNYTSYLNRIKVLNNGDICIFGSATVPVYGGFGIVNSPIFILLNSSGTLLWSKMYHIGTNSFDPEWVIENASGDLIFAGIHSRLPVISLPSVAGVGAVLLDRSTGTVAGTGGINTLMDSDGGELYLHTLDAKNNAIVMLSLNLFGPISLNHTFSSHYLKINNNGSFASQGTRFDASNPHYSVKLYNVNFQGNSAYFSGAIDKDTVDPSAPRIPLCLKTNSTLTTVNWTKKYQIGQNSTRAYSMIYNPSSSALLIGCNDASKTFLKINPNTGMAACNSTNESVSITNFTHNDSIFIPTLLHDPYLNPGITATLVPTSTTTIAQALTTTVICWKKPSLTGIDEAQPQPVFKVFPNPTSNVINLTSATEDLELLKITDIIGNTLMTIETNGKSEISINTTKLNPGVYMIIGYDKNKSQTKSAKFIVE